MSFEQEMGGFVQWDNGVKAVIYNGKIIVLSELNNDFIFFDDTQSGFIASVLCKHSSELSKEEFSSVSDLISHGLIFFDNKFTKKCFQDEITSKGAFECDWALGDSRASLASFRPKYFIKALVFLLSARRNSSRGRLHQLLESLRRVSLEEMAVDTSELIKIASNVNLAIGFLWRKVKCLEFAYAVARIAFRYNISCRFIIGVQTHPFISHAWVEGEDGVVFDRKELPKELAKIISIGEVKNA